MFKGDKPWFNYECKVARQNYRKLKRKLKIKRTEALKQDVAEAEKRFRRVPFLSSIIGENIITIITSRLIIPRGKFKFEICNSWRVNIIKADLVTIC
jgi:hypothetical protein